MLNEQIDIRYAIKMQADRKIDLSKLDTTQKRGSISRLNRAELLEHLQGICSEVGFRRQTYYLALTYIDVTLTHEQVNINKFQLLGITALFMAAKMEELEPQVASKFATLTSNVCKSTDICKRERELVKRMGWKLNPDTLYFWFEYFVRCWDQFVVFQGLNEELSIKRKRKPLAAPPKGSHGLDENEFLSTSKDKASPFFIAH